MGAAAFAARLIVETRSASCWRLPVAYEAEGGCCCACSCYSISTSRVSKTNLNCRVRFRHCILLIARAKITTTTPGQHIRVAKREFVPAALQPRASSRPARLRPPFPPQTPRPTPSPLSSTIIPPTFATRTFATASPLLSSPVLRNCPHPTRGVTGAP